MGTCRDASPTSQMRVEIQAQSGHLPWVKKEQGSKEIEFQELFNQYWSSKAHEFPVLGQSDHQQDLSSLTEKRREHCCWETQFLSGIIVLCRSYCPSLGNCAPQAAYHFHAGGISSLLAPSTGGVIKGLLPTDERTDGAGFG